MATDPSREIVCHCFDDDAKFVMGDVDFSYEIEPIETGTLTITEIPLEGYFVVETD